MAALVGRERAFSGLRRGELSRFLQMSPMCGVCDVGTQKEVGTENRFFVVFFLFSSRWGGAQMFGVRCIPCFEFWMSTLDLTWSSVFTTIFLMKSNDFRRFFLVVGNFHVGSVYFQPVQSKFPVPIRSLS